MQADGGYAVTHHARQRIRDWFLRFDQDATLSRGERIIEEELRRVGLPLRQDHLSDIISLYPKCGGDVGQFLIDVANGVVPRSELSSYVRGAYWPSVVQDDVEAVEDYDVRALDVRNLHHRLAKCCNPVNTDEIVGYICRGARGMSVHRRDCPRVAMVEVMDRLMPLSWERKNGCGTKTLTIRIVGWNMPKLTDRILEKAKDERITVVSLDSRKISANGRATISLNVSFVIERRDQLSRFLRGLNDIDDIISAHCQGITVGRS